MLSITPEALDYIRKEENSIFLEMPKLIQNCCFDLQECPTVRFGIPRDPQNYEQRKIGDATVYVPARFPDNTPLTVTVNTFLGFRRLVLEGWNYC
ncbi:MAG: hypothetical protein GX423_09395 [Nitrospiraceae bacterium]|jgi:hypothetical protein|nr:hypothetical protein [Nitrospiraceae bacterium]